VIAPTGSRWCGLRAHEEGARIAGVGAAHWAATHRLSTKSAERVPRPLAIALRHLAKLRPKCATPWPAEGHFWPSERHVEGTHNPLVPGSSPGGPTFLNCDRRALVGNRQRSMRNTVQRNPPRPAGGLSCIVRRGSAPKCGVTVKWQPKSAHDRFNTPRVSPCPAWPMVTLRFGGDLAAPQTEPTCCVGSGGGSPEPRRTGPAPLHPEGEGGRRSVHGCRVRYGHSFDSAGLAFGESGADVVAPTDLLPRRRSQYAFRRSVSTSIPCLRHHQTIFRERGIFDM
jgi:hypothetical protein